MFKRGYNILILMPLLFLTACQINYTFTGSSLDPAIETISIKYFPNRAPLVNPDLSQAFTEGLKDRFLSQTSLRLVQRNGDIHFEGEIKEYRTAPVNIQGNDQAAQTRLTITIRVKFINTVQPEYDFDASFSRYADFNTGQSFASVESQLVEEIVEQITEDIFNKAAANW